MFENMMNYISRIKIANENRDIVRKTLHLIPITSHIKVKLECLDKLKYNKDDINNDKINIDLIPLTTNQAIRYYKNINPNSNIAVLNFANSQNPGGGYLKGCMSQEEELCRTSPYLYASLDKIKKEQNVYPFDWNTTVLYTQNVQFIRNDYNESKNNHLLSPAEKEYNLLKIPYTCSVITAAAPNLNSNSTESKIYSSETNHNKLYSDLSNLLATVYLTPHIVDMNSQINVLILGSIGSGIFAPKSNPEYATDVANIFVNILKTYHNHYDVICF